MSEKQPTSSADDHHSAPVESTLELSTSGDTEKENQQGEFPQDKAPATTPAAPSKVQKDDGIKKRKRKRGGDVGDSEERKTDEGATRSELKSRRK